MKRLIITSLSLAALCTAASAQVPMGGAGLGAPSTGGGAGGQSVWNPSDKNTSVTLSTTTITNDTATQNSAASSFRMVRGTQSYATGTANKKIFTLGLTAVDTGAGWLGGVSDAGVSLTGYPGVAAHSFGIQAGPSGTDDYQDGIVTGSTCAGSGTFNTGSTLWIAIDFNTGNIWCSTNCTTWIGGGSPDNGTGPAYTLSSATYFPAWSGFFYFGAADTAVLNTKPIISGCSNVTNFSQWG